MQSNVPWLLDAIVHLIEVSFMSALLFRKFRPMLPACMHAWKHSQHLHPLTAIAPKPFLTCRGRTARQQWSSHRIRKCTSCCESLQRLPHSEERMRWDLTA